MQRIQEYPEQGAPAGKGGLNPYLKWGCLGTLAVGLCACIAVLAGGGVLVARFGGEPEGLSASYAMPGLVARGETFELSISMTNTGDSDLLVSDIDLDEAFGGSILDGAIVLGTEPPMERDYSLSGIKTFHYNRTLAPGETRSVVFTLQAVETGEFGGSIGIYVGDLARRFDYVALVVTE